jgi:hypothetical protein
LEDRVVLTVSQTSIALVFAQSAESYSNFITQAYQKYLGRPPLSSEVNAWLGPMQHGFTDEQLEAGFIGAPEYIANHGGHGAGWVTGMYKDLLGRTPTQDEVNAWVNALNNGTVPRDVAYGFAASAEREGNRVRGDYATFLGRTPSDSEVNAWVSYFVQGGNNETVAAGFAGSTEYYNNHLKSPSAWLTALFQDILHRAPSSTEYTAWYQALTGQAPATTFNSSPNLGQQDLAATSPTSSLTDVTQLTAATDASGNVRELALDADYRLWIYNGSTWMPEASNVYSVSTAVNVYGNVEVFAVDGDGTAWFQVLFQTGQVSNWYQLFPDNVPVSAVSAVLDASGNMEFFITDTSNHLFQRTADAYNNFSGWDSLNGFVSSVSAVLDSSGNVELFAIGGNTKDVFQRVEGPGGTWGNWLDLSNFLSSTYGFTPVTAYSISATTDRLGDVELFAAGFSGNQSQNIYQVFEDSSGTWGANWWNLGINNKAASVAATQDGNSNVNLFAVGAISHNAFANVEYDYGNDPNTGALYGFYSGWSQQNTGVTSSVTYTDYTQLAQAVTTPHQGPTTIYLNFDGGDVTYQNGGPVTEHFSAFIPNSSENLNQEIQNIINMVAQIYAPFNAQVQQIHGFGNYDSSSNGNTTIFVGPDSNNTASDGRKYNSSSTPFAFCDVPGAVKGYNHKPNSDPFDLAFVDPYYQQQAGGSLFIESDAQIASGIAHEAGHTFGLMHVLTGDGSGTYSTSNPPDVMSYDAPNQQFLNQTFNLTDLNYDPVKGGNVHGGDHFYPIWNNNGTNDTIKTQNSYTYLLAVLGAHP